jgi:DNA-binding transcriptional MerR regulator
MKPLLTTAEVAEMFGLSPKTLRNWRCLQVGPPFVKHRGRIYYRSTDLDAYAAALPLAS